MRTLSFENLRRLVGRRKERDEPSFERSESFKRISIRKSYLDRGKRRTRLTQKANEAAEQRTSASNAPMVTVEVTSRPSRTTTKNLIIGPTIVQVRNNDDDELDEKKEKRISRDDIKVIEISEELVEDDYEEKKKIEKDTPAGTIVYGQWLNDADSSYSSKDRKYKIDSFSSRDTSKFESSRDNNKIYISHDYRPFEKRNLVIPVSQKIDEEESKKIESILTELEKSPRSSQSRLQVRAESDSVVDEYEVRKTPNDCTCGNVTTVNIVPSHDWTESPSLPKNNRVAESSSLDSKLNEAHSRTSDKQPVTCKTDTSSTRASGFSLSLSISRLTTDLRAAALTTKNGLFRRRKRVSGMKPAPSVSAEGYFERTAGAGAITSSTRRSRRSAALGSGRRRKPGYASARRRKTSIGKSSPVVAAPDSPVWFVPPERRRSNRQRGRVWREVRYLPQEEEAENRENKEDKRSNDDSNLSDEFDDKKLLQSGDFEERSEALVSPRKAADSSTLDSSSLISSDLASSSSLKPKISDFNEEKIFYEGYRGDKSKLALPTECNYFASSQFLGFVAKSAGSRSSAVQNSKTRCDCSSSSESDEQQRRVLLVVGGAGKKDAAVTSKVSERRNCSVVLVLEGAQRPSRQQDALPAGQRRRPLRRKSQLKRSVNTPAGCNSRGQPVYLARKRSSLRRRPCSKSFFFCFY